MIDDLERLATMFRAAIEKCDRSKLPISFAEFPRGACGDAVLLLGTYLIENGYEVFDYMLGQKGVIGDNDWSSHAWLQRGELVIDITADQFPEIQAVVIVREHSEWHRTLNGETENIADYRIFDSYTRNILDRAYHQVLSNLVPT